MPAVTIEPADLIALQPDLDPARAALLIQGTLARAALVAPCILTDDFTYAEAAKAIIIDAILRRVESGFTGSISSEAAGPMARSFFVPPSRGLFWASEISELEGLCAASATVGGSTALPVYNMPAVDCPDPFRAAPSYVLWHD